MDQVCDRILPPRVDSEFGTTPLTEVLQELLEQDGNRVVALEGDGCTSALNYVQAWAERHFLSVATMDGWLADNWSTTGQVYKHVKVRLTCNCQGPQHLKLQLSTWSRDEYIEYLLKYHPLQCKRVMTQLASVDQHFALGSPFVWQPYLEWLANHESHLEPAQFVWAEMVQELAGTEKLTELAEELLNQEDFTHLSVQLSGRINRWLRVEDIQLELKANRLSQKLRNRDCEVLTKRLDGALIKSIARKLAEPIERSVEECRVEEYSVQSMIAFLQSLASNSRYSATSFALLLRLDPEWKPQSVCSIDLLLADLRGAKWDDCSMPESTLMGTQLSDSSLRCADLSGALMRNSSFSRSAMVAIQLNRVRASECSFIDANIERGNLQQSRFVGCDFQRACLNQSVGSRSYLGQTNMESVQLQRAKWDGCVLEDVNLEGAQLDKTDLSKAKLLRVNLKNVSVLGVDFLHAEFASGSNLELLDFSDCVFDCAILKGVYLTDSVARNASFRCAELSEAGLAGVLWENCDLRGADLRGAAFHMGSTRCGLVDSPYPSHGTRTGFYTDDYVDLTYKHPEQVRKAALIGCDLRGALLHGCDFYLVDVRDCLLDPAQRELMVACGAILD